MIKFIKKLLGICDHNWETEKSIKIYDTGWGATWYRRTDIHCRCTKCGAWKKFKL